MKQTLILLWLALQFAGCGSSSGIRQLGDRELEAFQALQKSLAANEEFIRGATQTLSDLGALYEEKEFELELALAKAKLLESMQAPWAPVRDSLAATQRAVILYYLYELEAAEQKAIDARIAQRRAAAQEVLAAYARLSTLIDGAAQNLKIIIEHLNQPKSARIRAFTSTFLDEVAAFRAQMQSSENPRLQHLAQQIARYEEQVSNARLQAQNAMDALLNGKVR